MRIKQFGERNPAWIAVLGTIALAMVVVLTFFSSSLPVIGGGTTYSARFTEAAGLTTSSEVRIAGVKVGKVTDVRLDGDSVLVSFKVKHAWVGDQTTASVELKTLLGQKYVELEPAGDRPLAAGATIPLERTTVPYDMSTALEGLASRVGRIDVPQLAASFRALSASFQGTPKDIRRMLTGLTALATTIGSRDTQLAGLMRNARQVTGRFAGLGGQLGRILADGDQLITTLAARRTALHQLVVGTDLLSRQVAGLVNDNRRRLAPALRKLDTVARILQHNGAHIDRALQLLAPYYTMLTDASGSGPWVDGYLCGLFDSNGRPELDPRAQRNCHPGGRR
ncbi:MCE family protein [Nocardioides ultimimeridianus]